LRIRLFSVLIKLAALGIVVAGCNSGPAIPTVSVSLLPTPAASPLEPTKPPAFSADKGAVVGHVSLPVEWKSVRAYLAPFYPDESGQNGFYLLEPSVHRSVDMRLDGYLQVSDVEPGKYVIVIGPSPEESRAIAADNGQPRVFNVEAGKLLDIGEVQLLSQ